MISVIIPLYNAKDYVCEAVASVLVQQVELELIVLDDASTDGSVIVLRQWLEAHQGEVGDISVSLIENKENMGVARTRNKGVLLAKGSYIAFLDADDRFAEGKLARQIKLLEETGADLCNTGRMLIRSDGENTGTVIHTPEIITLSELEKSNRINCSSVLLRRETALRYPMEHSEVHEDYLTWLRMLRDYAYAVGIDEPLLEYRLSENGKSRNKLKSARMTYRTYRLAGYSVWKSCRMFAHYTVKGLKKYAKR